MRLLASGPRCGLNEINLPAMAPGSTIMPGKVNPIIPEVVNQVAYIVIGNDVTVSFAAEAGQLELNVMEPVIAFSLFNSLVGLAARLEDPWPTAAYWGSRQIVTNAGNMLSTALAL